jgi:intracellular sulfur oxidation DsrE/DsrF family protein
MTDLSRRTLAVSTATALAAGLLPAAAPAQSAAPAAVAGRKNKVVFQVSDNDPGKWGLALNNAHNVMTDLGEDTVDIEIVVYGPGIAMLKAGSPLTQRITATLKSGVKVVACENTMKAQQLTYKDMLPDIGYVPAGVVELMQKQQQGYAYIRP